MEWMKNPHRGRGLGPVAVAVADDPAGVMALLAQCPAHAETPLADAARLAEQFGVARFMVKDERTRMGLGSFKALGAAYVIARDAAAARPDAPQGALAGRTYVTASAGNHGMSVAAGARVFGAKAVIYLAATVPAGFADRLRAKGAVVVVEGADYAASMAAAARAARANGWTLLSDSTWNGYDTGLGVMEGYLALGAEAVAQAGSVPSHVFLQAGVGGLAAAMAAHFRRAWGDAPLIVVVEPVAAPALHDSIRAGRVVVTDGPVSTMGRLDCKEPSHRALAALARDADAFMLVSDAEVAGVLPALAAAGFATSASGGAGLAGAALARKAGRIGADARVLTVLSEGPTDD